MNFDFLVNDIVKNARYEITSVGYEQLQTVEAVDEAFNKKGTTLVMINSVCGCAGGKARPAAELALEFSKRPDYLVSVFAGQDFEATERAREFFTGYTPSSPSFALLKDGKICSMVERSDIEGSSVNGVVEKLQSLFEQYC
ncbi:MAG: bacilliredoxin, YphP/YqiW family protein [Bacillales bacterium]|jgi:putative YphP/YqiW family bacilliredoxin|nr:bacilliredoxin, YphP/YqiW family protein [Bacillales bacterium]